MSTKSIYIVLVTYPENGNSYIETSRFLESLKAEHITREGWVVNTELSVKELFNEIRELHSGEFFIAEITSNHAGMIKTSYWDKIKSWLGYDKQK